MDGAFRRFGRTRRSCVWRPGEGEPFMPDCTDRRTMRFVLRRRGAGVLKSWGRSGQLERRCRRIRRCTHRTRRDADRSCSSPPMDCKPGFEGSASSDPLISGVLASEDGVRIGACLRPRAEADISAACRLRCSPAVRALAMPLAGLVGCRPQRRRSAASPISATTESGWARGRRSHAGARVSSCVSFAVRRSEDALADLGGCCGIVGSSSIGRSVLPGARLLGAGLTRWPRVWSTKHAGRRDAIRRRAKVGKWRFSGQGDPG